jgi:large subunit ribosomal protein L3
MGRKRGMTQVFDNTGKMIPCTVIEVEPNIVTQIKTTEKDGYNAIQLGCDMVQVDDERTMKKRMAQPELGHFKKSGVAPRKTLQESRLDSVEGYTLGQEIKVDLFKDVPFVDARAVTIGKGFAGAMKRYGFKGMRATHGVSAVHRSLGSTGNRSTPGRCFKNKKMPGHMGNKPITTQNLKVVEVNEEENCIIVKGAIPGPKNGLVTLKPSVKKGKV